MSPVSYTHLDVYKRQELPRIKGIAAGYEKDHSLAQALWKEDIRECKILAGLLQPVESFLPDIADIWVEDIRNI